MELLSRVCVASSAAAGLPFLAAVCHAAELSQIPFHTAGRFTAALWESCNSRRCFTPTQVGTSGFMRAVDVLAERKLTSVSSGGLVHRRTYRRYIPAEHNYKKGPGEA